jgi:hypothetical protein
MYEQSELKIKKLEYTMKLFFLSLLLLATANADASNNTSHECESQEITWDSDGQSPAVDHAKCVGNLVKAASGATQTVQALTTDDAGGVGFAQFRCVDGAWVIDTSHFGEDTETAGYCAD